MRLKKPVCVSAFIITVFSYVMFCINGLMDWLFSSGMAVGLRSNKVAKKMIIAENVYSIVFLKVGVVSKKNFLFEKL